MALGGERPPYPELRHGHVSEAVTMLALLGKPAKKTRKKSFRTLSLLLPSFRGREWRGKPGRVKKTKLLFGSPLTQICA
jgi:hypothetical protein